MYEEGHTIWVNNWEDPDIEIINNGGNVSVLVVLGKERPSHVFGDLLRIVSQSTLLEID